MKKLLFLAGVAAMTLASCSQEEVLNVNDFKNADKEVSFRVRSSKASRSVEYSTENLDEFKVFGYVGFPEDNYEAGEDLLDFFKDGDAVTFTRGEDNIFTSATKYYYPGDGSFLYFAAYAPASLAMQSMPYGGMKLDYTVDTDITKQVDIICAEGVFESESAAEGPMEFDFHHALTKVFVSELRSRDTDHNIEIAGVRFGNIYVSGEHLFCGEHSLARDPEDSQNEVFTSDGYIANGEGRIFWKPTGEQTATIDYIFDTPVALNQTTTSVELMSGADATATTKKEAFMMIPQQLNAQLNEDESKIESFSLENSYIAFLIRVTKVHDGSVVYPFTAGVENISETIGEGDAAVTYAWAAFPVSSLWVPGLYVDYLVDFSDGVGFVAPGADAELELRPIIGPEVTFTANVFDWDAGDNTTITHDHEVTVNVADMEDPF